MEERAGTIDREKIHVDLASISESPARLLVRRMAKLEGKINLLSSPTPESLRLAYHDLDPPSYGGVVDELQFLGCPRAKLLVVLVVLRIFGTSQEYTGL